MKIAVTADVHLNEKHQERFDAFKNIVNLVRNKNIKYLIVAGDLFDQDDTNYPFFDEYCKKNEVVEFLIIPGNHDLNLTQSHFTATNVKVFSETEIFDLPDSKTQLLFVPYKNNIKMVDGIIEKIDKLEENKWILVSHGDCIDGTRRVNPYEQGIYMPISSYDIEKYNPIKVILGHIHKRTNQGKVHYVGSPCGMDINETGYRKFSILDLNKISNEDLFITDQKVDTKKIYINDKMIVSPLPLDSEDNIRKRIHNIIDKNEISEEDKNKVIIRLKVSGYYQARDQLQTLIKKELSDCKFYEKNGLDLTDVLVAEPDETRLRVAREAIRILGNKINDEIKYNIMKIVFEK